MGVTGRCDVREGGRRRKNRRNKTSAAKEVAEKRRNVGIPRGPRLCGAVILRRGRRRAQQAGAPYGKRQRRICWECGRPAVWRGVDWVGRSSEGAASGRPYGKGQRRICWECGRPAVWRGVDWVGRSSEGAASRAPTKEKSKSRSLTPKRGFGMPAVKLFSATCKAELKLLGLRHD
jgi:hypothetical protein